MKRVLLVEDEILISMLITSEIEKHDFTVVSVCNGEKAIEFITDGNKTDIILMDIDLGSGINGLEAAEHILETVDIPVIFITNHAEKSTIERIRKITQYGYVLKNSGEMMLVQSMNMALELHSLRSRERSEITQVDDVLGTYFRNNTFGNIVCSLSGDIISVNSLVEKTTGYSMEELQHLSLFDLIKGENSESIITLILETAHTDMRTPLRRKNSTAGYWHFSSVKINNSHIFCIIQDISDRVEMEKSLTDKTSLLDTVLNSPSICFLEYTLEGNITGWNNSFVEFIGFSADELREKTINDVIHPGDQSKNDQLLKSFSETEINNFTVEKRYVCKNGAIKWTETDISVRLDGENRAVSVIEIIKDIDDRKTSEEILRRNEQLFRLFFDKEPDYCYVLDSEGTVLNINSSALEVLGRTREGIIGKSLITSVYSPECQKKAYEFFRHWVKTGQIEPQELTIINSNGKKRSVSLSASRISDDPTEPAYSILIQHDITEEKIAHDRIQNLLEHQELIMKEIHHRIKNDMNAIQSLLVLQFNSAHNIETKNALRDANSRISIMRNIYSKLFRHDDFKKISLRELITELINDIQMGYETTTVIQHKVNIADIFIESKYAFRIGIIVNELIINAYKHSFTDMAHGNIFTEINGNGENKINIAVSNDGIPANESLIRMENPGFGLNLVNTLSHQNGGSFKVSNNEGTVRFEISFIRE